MKKSIAQVIIKFVNEHIGQEFTGRTLRTYVLVNISSVIAPGSPDRIMRELKKKKLINYELVSRHESLYKAVPLVPKGEPIVDTTA